MEQISLGNQHKERMPRRSSNSQTKVLVGRDVFKELEERRASPSVIAKLRGIDVLPPNVAHNWHQEFKDVFEVLEEPEEAARKERQHHFPKGLKPSLKQSALKLKRLMPSKVLYVDDTHGSIVQCSGGLDRLNSVGINNPLFEKRPHDMNYSPNYQYEKDPVRACRKYPLGLANSSLSDFRNLLRGEVEDFSNIVVLEPSMEKCHDPENIFSIPYLPPVKKNCQRGTKHKQTVFPMVGNGPSLQLNSGNEDVELRMRKERCSTSDSIDPLLNGQEAFSDHFSTSDLHYSELSQRYFTNKSNFRRSNKSSSKMRQQYEESACGSKTLAEMFALSDSERLKLNTDSHAQIHHSTFDLNNGHSKEGCFIVLPKRAPPLSLQSLVDRDASLEGPPKGTNNNLTTSISYNNGNIHLDSFRGQTRLLKQIGNNSKDNMRNVSNFNCLMVDNFSSPDCLNEKVLCTTDENIVRHHAYSKASAFDLQLARKQKATRLQFHCHEYESMSLSDPANGIKSCKGLKEVEQPSPVSILEPLTDEDSSGHFKYDLQEMAKKRKDMHQLHDEPEVTMSSDEDYCDYQSLEVFQVEEDRDFSYLLDILVGSGIVVADWQLLCKSWYSPGCPVGPHVFDRLERKYSKLSTWAKSERKLLFDLVNSILSEVLAPCIDVHPWVPSRSQCAPLWGPEGPVEKVWQTIVKQREEFVIGYPDEMVLDPTWPDIGDDVSMVGKQIARMLHGDLMEEIIVEFLSGSQGCSFIRAQPRAVQPGISSNILGD